MPDADTDTRAGLDLDKVERTHYRIANSPECRGCDQTWPCDAARLLDELKDARQEIARHHKQFDEWEELAAKGARSIEERRRLRVVADAAQRFVDLDVAMDRAYDSSGYWPSSLNETRRNALDELEMALDALDAPAPPHVVPEGAERGKEGL